MVKESLMLSAPAAIENEFFPSFVFVFVLQLFFYTHEDTSSFK